MVPLGEVEGFALRGLEPEVGFLPANVGVNQPASVGHFSPPRSLLLESGEAILDVSKASDQFLGDSAVVYEAGEQD